MSSSSPSPRAMPSRYAVTSPVPNLQAGHCPHDSTYRNRLTMRATATMSAVSSNTMKPHAPRPDPTAAMPSYDSGVSTSAAVSTGFATPDSAALNARPSRTPPPIDTSTSDSGVPSSNSATPARWTSPTTVAMAVPGDSAVPTDRYQSAPREAISGTFARVSTLVTRV